MHVHWSDLLIDISVWRWDNLLQQSWQAGAQESERLIEGVAQEQLQEEAPIQDPEIQIVIVFRLTLKWCWMEQVVISVYRWVQINDSNDKQISTARPPKSIFKIYPWSLPHGPFVSNFSGSVLALLYPETSTPKLWEMSKWFGSLDFLLPRCRWVLNFSAWASGNEATNPYNLNFTI